MDFWVLLTTLKTLSVMVAGLLGILGLLGNFRGKDGKLKKWGYAALFFIGISTAVSILTTLIESRKEQADALEQLSRMEGLLQELYRVGQPITQLEISFGVGLPTTDKAVLGYIEELKQAIDSRKKDRQPLFPGTQGLRVTNDQNGELLEVEVNQESPYWPKKKQMIGNVAKHFGFRFYLRKDPIKPERFSPVVSKLGDPEDSDWSAIDLSPKTKNWISVDYKNKTVFIHGLTIYAKRFWVTNGKIGSILDLYGSQILLLPPEYYQPHETFEAIKDPSLNTLVGSLKIKMAVFSFSSGHQIWVDGTKFEKTVDRLGSTVFSIILPKNRKELLDLGSVKNQEGGS